MLTPEPELSPDLEWMLSGTQATREMIIDAAVEEHGQLLLGMAYILLGDRPLARLAVWEGINDAIKIRHRYRQTNGAREWLLRCILRACRKKLPGLKLKRAISSVIKTNNDPNATLNALPASMAEADLWLAFDSLPEGFKVPYMLSDIFHIPVDEISQVYKTNPESIMRRIQAAKDRIIKNISSVPSDVNVWMESSLKRRWSLPDAQSLDLPPNKQAFIQHAKRLNLNFLYSGIFLLFVLAVASAGGYLNSLAEREGLSPRAVKTVVVTQLVKSTRLVTPQPTPTFKPLSANVHDLDEIHNRIAGSAFGDWNTLFLDATMYNYGPDGYIGAPLTYRSQLWHEKSSNGEAVTTVLSGQPFSKPETSFMIQNDFVYETDLATGLSYSYFPNEPQGLGTPPKEYLRELNELRSSRDGTRLLEILFGSKLLENFGDIQSISKGSILSRQVVIVETHSETNNQPRQLWWVDADLGVILRWQQFDINDRDLLVTEVYPADFSIDNSFPDEGISGGFMWRKGVDWKETNLSSIGTEYGMNWRTLRQINSPLPRPEGSPVFINSRLTFEWQSDNSANIWLNDRFLLGTLDLGDPWGIVCRRSPDGRYIAYIPAERAPDGVLYSGAAPLSIDLDDNNLTSYHTLAAAIFASSDFAFSPDSSQLAFWACGGSESNCGIYIHSLETRKNVKLKTLRDGATYFQWSPDGNQLAFVGADPKLAFDSTLAVVDTSSGQIIYQGEFRWPGSLLPEDTPAWILSSGYPPLRYRLEGCAGWQKD